MTEPTESTIREIDEPQGPEKADSKTNQSSTNLWFLVLVVGLILAAVTASLPRKGDPIGDVGIDPRQISLTDSDLPAGFIVGQHTEAYSNNDQASGGDSFLLGQYNTFGRESGYDVDFARSDASGGDVPSILQIHGSVAVYGSVDGARALIDLLTSSSPPEMDPMPVPQLGDQAVATTSQTDDPGAPAIYRFITIRKGRVVSSIVTTAPPGAGLSESIELAQKAAAKLP